ncbi:tRNA lysidine(34) synthetase TilS [Pontivivens nitratireducens]|uniref:tRNA lysidine(34) synthetase TilS n=1 Tax=Pontivivens nitratireducens TaxID=2758038 RepID=UPI001639D79F|nr:tRNA lysidine(34) synthetase TilS [Pontibrevibacter nitratireducens]
MLDHDVLSQRLHGPLGVAVSGGGDSVALLIALRDWANSREVALKVATVDHALRSESAEEARWVGRLCRDLDLPHVVLNWHRAPDATGNLAEQARHARRTLLADWIVAEGGRTVVLGHTRDDLAETFLMRLARGSGLAGLSAMQAVSDGNGVRWLRPMLNTGRSDLRGFLTERNQTWHDDPSNEDDLYQRARTRKALAVLRGIDIDAGRIAQTAHRLRDSRIVVDRHVADLARNCLSQTRFGEIILSKIVFDQAPAILQQQLLRDILRYFSGSIHAPRFEAIVRLHGRILAGEASTLSGVQISGADRICRFSREPAFVPPMVAMNERRVIWDHRWTVSVLKPGYQLGPLGVEGVRQCGARPRGVRATTAHALPAIWDGDEVVATPVLKPRSDISFRVRHFAGPDPH